jgi:D-beta-D-heptose 7-phosphate kinase/D-beta-D-heptose 1-phosphate adenosyltransferase
MNSYLFSLVDTFADLDVVVIGDAMLDAYLEGTCHRLSQEAPVPVVSVTERKLLPGGAANTAANVARLGARAHFLSVIGDDTAGRQLRRVLKEGQVSTEHILVHPERRTLAKQRVVGSAHMLVRFDEGSTHAIDSETEKRVIERLTALHPACDALIISDYGYGILTPGVIEAIAKLQARKPRFLVVDSKYLSNFRHTGITVVKPNYPEFLELIGKEGIDNGHGERAAWVARYGGQLLKKTGAEIAAVTLDTEGAIIFERNSSPYRTYAEPKPDFNAAGAGDTFVSAFTLALAAGASIPTAAEVASAATAVVVGRNGTRTCSADALRGYLADTDKLIADWQVLAARIDLYRRYGRRVVFTNGCFDILHRGHIDYLQRAKAMGDVLVVGLNSDDSVRRLKGPSRPINPLEDRASVLAGLSSIDHIVPFGENTPSNLIRVVRPDVFVKGGDYTRETLPEASLVEELGGKVVILSYLENHSTTSIIDRIQEAEEASMPHVRRTSPRVRRTSPRVRRTSPRVRRTSPAWMERTR